MTIGNMPRTGTAISRAASRSWATARMATPYLERAMKAPSSPMMAMDTIAIRIDCIEIETPW